MSISVVLALAVVAPANAADDLVVTVTGVAKTEGMVRGLLWTTEEGFPSNPKKAVGRAEAPAASPRVTLVFRDVEPGRYAVSVIHDANDNEQLDTNFIGVPKEGVGISNDAIGLMGPRDFEDALVDVDASKSKLEIEFHHW